MRKTILLLITLTTLFMAAACAEEEVTIAEVEQAIETNAIEEPEIEQHEEIEEVEDKVEEVEPYVEEIVEALQEPPPPVETPYISEFGRQVTKDFLAQFPTIFGFEHDGDSNAPFSLDVDLFTYFQRAHHFSLFNFDSSGIPHIIIAFSPADYYYPIDVLYGFVGGQFAPMHVFDSYPRFFRDDQEALVLLYNDDYHGFYGFYFVEFVDNELSLKRASPEIITVDDLREWDAFMVEVFREMPTIFGTNIAITPISHLEQLQSEITTSIRERLGVSQ